MHVLSIAFALADVGEDAVGGAEQILAQIDRALVHAGHDSWVIGSTNSQVKGRLFATTPAPPNTGDYYAYRYWQHKRAIETALHCGSIDLIHMHGYDFHEFIPDVDIPILVTLHLPPGWYPNWIYATQGRRIHINCVSPAQRMCAPDSSVIVATVNNGVPIPQLDPLPSREREGAVMLSRICPDKGTHIGIAAARKADVQLKIGGRVFAFPEHLTYFNSQVLPALNERTTFLGAIAYSQKVDLLRRASCLLVPSIVPETSSLVSMEALACGTPVIAMRSGALPQIVEDGKTGFVVDSEAEMADAIRRVSQIDPNACRRAALERFSVRRMVREYFELYERLIDGEAVMSTNSRRSDWATATSPNC